MSVRVDLVDILDRCVADVRAGRTTVERCLDEYPTYRAELEPLLRAAAAIVPSRAVPDPAAKLRGRVALVEAMHAGVEERPSWHLAGLFGLRSRAAAIATAMVLMLTSSGVAVVAAQDAQPYEPLYPLKTAVEHQQLAFTGSPEARAQLRVHIASRRLAEAERAIEAGREDAAIFAAAAYGETMQQAYEDMDRAQDGGRGAAEAHEAAEDSLARLQDVTARAKTAGTREAAAALAAAAAAQAERDRAERDRARPPTATPSRPSAPVLPTLQPDIGPADERAAVVVALDDEESNFESDVDDSPPAPEPAPPAVQPPPVAAPAPVGPAVAVPAVNRPPTPLPAQSRAQPPVSAGAQAGPANQSRSASGSSNDRDDDDRDERSRGQTGADSSSQRQIEPTRVPTAVRQVLATPTLQRSGGQRQDSDDRGNQGRGRDDDRDRVTPTRTPTPGARNAPPVTARATSTSARPGSSGPNRPGNRDRDDDDEDRDRNRGRD